MNHTKVLLVILFTAIFFISSTGFTEEPEKNWQAFSENLVVAIKSGNTGLQQSAMQRIIQYSDKLDVSDAVWDIANIFRFDDNPKVRQLAMVTLYKINTDKAMEYLSKYIKLETEDCMQRQACCILQQYAAAKRTTTEDLVASK